MPRAVPGPFVQPYTVAPRFNSICPRAGAPPLSLGPTCPSAHLTRLAPACRPGGRFCDRFATVIGSSGARCEALQITPFFPRPPAFCRQQFNETVSFFAFLAGVPTTPTQPLPRSPFHRPPPIPTAAAHLSMHLRLPSRFVRPPAPLSRVFACMCTQAPIMRGECPRGGPAALLPPRRRPRRRSGPVAPAPHSLPSPLSLLTSPSLPISTPTTPSPSALVRPSSPPTPHPMATARAAVPGLSFFVGSSSMFITK